MSGMNDLENHAIIFSFITPRETDEEEEIPLPDQKKILAKAFQCNKTFENGELLDTLEQRALYPLIHCVKTPKSEVNNIKLMKKKALGEYFLLQQGIYVESKCYTSLKYDKNFEDGVAYIFMGFRSVDATHSDSLEKSWKDWTGARIVNACLSRVFYLRKFSFFHRISPPDKDLFMYILIIECHNVRNNNKTYLLDLIQRLRVERVFGYLTVYTKEFISTTSTIISNILAEHDDSNSQIEV